MKRKDGIIEKGRICFNLKGINHITLRDIAEKMNISYGNLTYYFNTKEKLLDCIVDAYLNELLALNIELSKIESPEKILFQSPALVFDIQLKYLFIQTDFLEIKRNFPEIFNKVMMNNQERIDKYRQLLLYLQSTGIFRQDISTEQFDFLMEASGALRTFFWMQNCHLTLTALANMKKKYQDDMHQLTYPYLSEKGIQLFQSID